MSNQSTPILEQQVSRREVMKKAAYVTPAILTLAAVPAFAAKGSGAISDKPKSEGGTGDKDKKDKDKKDKDKKDKD